MASDFSRNMKYFEDPLLKSKSFVSDNRVLNLYSALVKLEDFQKKRSLNSIPYLEGKVVEQVKELITDDLIKDFEEYMQQKVLNRTVRCWLKRGIIPFPLLRVISLRNKKPIRKLSSYIKQIDSITNNQKSTHLSLPKSFPELLSADLIYFYGYLLGDGCISRGMLMKLCDGHPNPKNMHYSLIFIRKIQDFIKKKFGLSSKITKINNKYELVLTSKSLCRFFKFFYDFKKDEGRITKPTILKDNKEKSCIFYRGLFDADAGIKTKDKYLVFKSADEKFLRICKKDLASCGVITSKICHDNLNIPFLKIYASQIYNFAKNIGFAHPKKQEVIINHLKKGCLIKKLKSVNTANLFEDKYYDLSKIKDLRLVGVQQIFRKHRKILGTQKQVAALLSTYRENIKRWENETDSVPFTYYRRLMQLNSIDLEAVLKDLSRRKVQFGKGRLKQYVTLPIKHKKSHLQLFKYLNPTKDKVIIKSYGLDNRNIDRKALFSEIEDLFNVKIIKDWHSHIICSNLISDFLSTFYEYEPSWKPVSEAEIESLKKRWASL